MPHPLFSKPSNRAKSAEELQGAKTLKHNQYIGEVFVGRRKVYETRAGSESEAFAAAQHVKEQKYKGTNAQVQIRKTKAKGDA